jgi:hypothetical protein
VKGETMLTIILIVLLILILFGGGGYVYHGYHTNGPYVGPASLVWIILFVVLIWLLVGRF